MKIFDYFPILHIRFGFQTQSIWIDIYTHGKSTYSYNYNQFRAEYLEWDPDQITNRLISDYVKILSINPNFEHTNTPVCILKIQGKSKNVYLRCFYLNSKFEDQTNSINNI